MRKLTVILGFVWLLNTSYSLFSQPYRHDSVEFYDYKTILNDLTKNGNKSGYYKNLDYEAMLFLDKTSFRVLKKVNPHFLAEQDLDTIHIFFEVPENSIKELPTNIRNIRDLFSPCDSLKIILCQLKIEDCDEKSDMKIDNRIYTKDDQEAIFSIRGYSWSVRCRVILTNQRLRFEELYVVQE